mmetsp:Transcript_10019/g.25005  ORF Transcript_10019/g.25005 Transcript_10019/m.25005 type:complete len:339 (+) Transcript_10019:220-1236(+)
MAEGDAAAEGTDAAALAEALGNSGISREADILYGGTYGSTTIKPQVPQMVSKEPKTIANCTGACVLPRSVHQTLTDLADLFVSPMVPGPLYVAGFLGADPDNRRGSMQAEGDEGGMNEDSERMDRLWELRLCVEHLRETLETYERSGERDPLTTSEEILSTVEDVLRRVAELGVSHRSGLRESVGSNQATATTNAPAAAAASAESDSSTLLEAIASLLDEPGAFTQCLLASRLCISGLLEAVLGELTEWQSKPSESDLRTWQRWDRTYERLARSVGRMPQLSSGGGFWIEGCCQGADCTAQCGSVVRELGAAMAGGQLAERQDVQPPLCASLCRPSNA